MTNQNDKCEGCDSPATTSDSEGVPLCAICFQSCVEDADCHEEPIIPLEVLAMSEAGTLPEFIERFNGTPPPGMFPKATSGTSEPTAQAEHTPEPVVRHIAISICQACLDGIGKECHTPGCALFLHRVDLPIHTYLYYDVNALSGIADPSGVKESIHEELRGILSACEGDGWSIAELRICVASRARAALAKLGIEGDSSK